MHKGLSEIGTQFETEAKNANSFRRLGNQQDRYSVALNHGRFNAYGYQKNGYSSSFEQVSGGHPTRYKDSVNPLGVEERADDLLNGRLEKMMVPFEKLEKLLLDKVHRHENRVIINKILSKVIVQAVGSSNPSKITQGYLDYYNRLYWTNKMKSCVANSMNADTITTSIFLKGLILYG